MLSGIPEGEFQQQKLTANQVKEAQRDFDVMEDLDKIKIPIEAKVYGKKQWNYRNEAFREMLSKMDKQMKEGLLKIIKDNTK